ncbi:MAG: hypothetical protein PHQ81_00495 [Methanofollis sp.]|nr:hypothetical protein [Methanofollis sp.]
MDDSEEIPVFSSRTYAFVAFPLAHVGGSRGAARPQVEESVENFRKEALQFEEIFTPREFGICSP